MPNRCKPGLKRPAAIQLPLFAEAASLIRIRSERNEFRYYRMEIGPTCSAASCCCASGEALVQRVAVASIPIPIPAPPSMRSTVSPVRNAAAVMGTAPDEPAAGPELTMAKPVRPSCPRGSNTRRHQRQRRWPSGQHPTRSRRSEAAAIRTPNNIGKLMISRPTDAAAYFGPCG
jgi:hypothetical protein